MIKISKEYLKQILRSIRTEENQAFVNAKLGQIDMLSPEKLEEFSKSLSEYSNHSPKDIENLIKSLYLKSISDMQNNHRAKFYSLNGAITYNIAGDCVALHMPISFTKPFGNTDSFHEAMDAFNPYLLDALEKLKQLKDNNYHLLNGVRSIELCSPILLKDELEWLKALGLETEFHKKGDLRKPDYVKANPKAATGMKFFPGKSFGIASLDFSKLYSKEFQDKKRQLQKEFENRGIHLSPDGPMQYN